MKNTLKKFGTLARKIALVFGVGVSMIANSQAQDVTLTVDETPRQMMRYGLDYERLWYWYGSGLGDVPQWSVNDCDIDFLRTAMNSGYELDEGVFNLSAYTNKIIPMMTAMQNANPEIKWFASPRPLNEAVSGASWQPYPLWVTGASSYTAGDYDFDATKCAEYMIKYLLLMKSYGFQISYMDYTNEWQSTYASGGRFSPDDAVTIKQVFDDYLNNPWPHPALDPGLLLEAEDFPLMIGSSAWNYSQGGTWIERFNTTARRNAIDIASSHNTDPTGSAQAFADSARAALGNDVEIWNTELHDWKSTSNYNEVTSFSYMTDAIRAGISGLSGWLAIGTTSQGHCYFLNNGSTVTRNVKYYIFKKLSNTSNYGYAYDINLPAGLESSAAMIKGDLMTVWVVNSSSSDLSTQINIGNQVMGNSTVTYTQWNESLSVEGVTGSVTADSASTFTVTVGAESVYCFEVDLSGPAVDDLVARWNFDEGTGSTTLDATGNGHDGTVVDASWDFGVEGSALAFDGVSSQVMIPGSAFSEIDDEITISLWARGGDSLPQDNSAFYAINSTGGRILNIHLPWSDSTVYWDAGDSGYDRINKTATAAEIKNSWAHWVFTKNANTGLMTIYRNGALWHSGTGKTKTMTSIASATIGSQTAGLYYTGNFDEVQLYSSALNATEVADLFASYTVPQPPAFLADSFSASNAPEGVGYNESIASSASDPEGDSLSYSKVSGPAWLNVASNGDLTGTPDEPDLGLNTWTVMVDDGNGGSDTATLTITVDLIPNKDALAIVEGESYDDQLGVSTQAASEGGLNVQNIQNGDWCAYLNVDFGSGVSEIQARVASSTAGGNIEIRLDGPTGPLAGTVMVENTTGWQTWETVSAAVSGLSGVQDLYLVFTGGSGYLLNLNWFSFAETPTTYSLSYSAGSGGSISGNSSQTVDHGSNGSAVSAVANSGYSFVNWSDGSSANPRTDSNVTGNVSVTANFAINSYTLSYSAGGGGSISGNGSQTVDHGSNGTAVTAVASAGYSFVNWSDSSTANPRTDSNVTGNVSVSANFALNSYTLSYAAGANGSITGSSSQNVNHGASGTAVSAVADTGYSFVDWSDGSTANPRTDGNVTGGVSVTANFAINTYSLSYSAGANGTITGSSSQTVDHGSDGSAVSAVADGGYAFVDWSDGSIANPRTDLDVTSNLSVTANFDLSIGDGIVAHWALDAGSGSTVADSTGNGFAGTMTGGSWVAGLNGNALEFDGTSSTVSLPTSAFATVSDEITVAMWSYGGASQPQNNSVFYAVDATGNRVLNIHLPWSNGNVYWDAGFSGGYDRLNKGASANEYQGQWNHWVFTKNATTGSMEIYLNGALWHSGTGKTRTISGIDAASLGSQISGVHYDGLIDEVQLYNVSLDATAVSDLYQGYTVINDVPVAWLISYGIEPTDAGALADTDNDGLANWEEYAQGKDPLVSDNPAGIRVNEYYLTTGDFSGTTATVSLNQALADDYYILVRGSRTGSGLSLPNSDYARVTAVPSGTGDLADSGSTTQITLTRAVADFEWEGVVTVVECTNSSSSSGFKLVDALTTNLSGTSGTDSSAAWSDVNQVVLFGGYRGGGASFVGVPTSRNQGTSVYTRLFPSGSGTLNWSRNAGGETLVDAAMTTFVVEWGSAWNVQHVNVAGAAGGAGADATTEYTTAGIATVNRDNTWVWGTGTRADAGIGDSAEACLITLGDGVSENASESTVAVGSEYTDAYSFDVYTMTHASLAVDHRFKVDGDSAATDLAVAVDSAASGMRMGWVYNGCNGTGTYFARPRLWARYTADGEVTISRGFSGQNFPAWVQGIDFSGTNQ